MDERVHRVAALANAAAYDSANTSAYVDGAPHVKHFELRSLYGELVVRVFDAARETRVRPQVLDLGAGEGSVTLPFLELGSHVIAVDISKSQLDELRRKTAGHAGALEVRCQDVLEAVCAIAREGRRVDVVVCNSFLHHVPDYLELIRQTTTLLEQGGQFFSFQDPMRYDTVGRVTRVITTTAYLSWRIFKGDLSGGIHRRLRRHRGMYLDIPEDHAEYHAIRKGVDQLTIVTLLEGLGFDCEIIRYFSTQSRLFQSAGSLLRLRNTFGVIARRR